MAAYGNPQFQLTHSTPKEVELMEENENLKLLVGCLLILHVQRGFGERSVAFAISQLTDKIPEEKIFEIFDEVKDVFQKFGK